MADQPRYDFFISRRGCDAAWAEWIAWVLEEAGYSAFLQDWDFVAGSNIPERMQKGATQALRTIAVLSPDYVESDFCNAEWLQRFFEDPTGKGRKLIGVRVRSCDPPGFLGRSFVLTLSTKMNGRPNASCGGRSRRRSTGHG